MIYARDYINTLIRFSNTKFIDIESEQKEIHKYILDKRFLKTRDLDELQTGIPYCKLVHLDDYWIGVYSYYPINLNNLFYNLLDKELIVPINEFLNYI